ncbi:MAG: hypothetical protein ACR2L8_09785 [Solirubrobacteraceae bacterium]
MNVPTRLAAFAVVLGVAFGGAALAGAAIDPTDEEAVVADAGHGAVETPAGGADAHGGEHSGGDAGAQPPAEEEPHGAPAGDAVSGLAVDEGGYAFEIDRSFFSAGKAVPFTFRITDERGRVVRDEFELEHDKRLHLIVVRRDTAIFEHVHPRKGEDGTWSVELNLREAGVYRAYADFKIGGEKRTLATDLFVPGEFRPQRLPAPEPTDRAVDTAGRPAGDLDVTLEAPGVRPGRETQLTFAVTRNGQPFEQLEPYLGAKGHLVALREGDLAYLHVHPTEGGSEHAHEDGSTSIEAHSNEIKFAATFPSAGRYRLFLQFKTGGEVRTVAYTVEVPR